MWGFRWTIQHRVVDIVQPDLHYFGGFIRCDGKVARIRPRQPTSPARCTWAARGLGYLDALHFMAWHLQMRIPIKEWLGAPSGIPITCETSVAEGPKTASSGCRRVRLRPTRLIPITCAKQCR